MWRRDTILVGWADDWCGRMSGGVHYNITKQPTLQALCTLRAYKMKFNIYIF